MRRGYELVHQLLRDVPMPCIPTGALASAIALCVCLILVRACGSQLVAWTEEEMASLGDIVKKCDFVFGLVFIVFQGARERCD